LYAIVKSASILLYLIRILDILIHWGGNFLLQLKRRVLWKFTPATGLSIAVIIFTICFSWLLPPSYGQENGPVENLQVVVVGLAALVAFRSLFETHLRPERRQLYALAGVFLLLAIGRELSWGRAFYMDNAGNIPPLKTLWFGPAVYPVIGVIIIGALVYLVAKGLHRELLSWLKHGSFPMLDLILVIMGMLVADIIEHHSFNLFGNRLALLEELCELVGYTAVLSFMINIVFSKHYRDDH
jgi:hypothetical protein